jgi:lysophospholipase L1-like esterase
MPNLLRTLLAPVLLVQGKRMFQSMPRLTPPTGDSTGTRGDGPPLRLLVTGDSAAAGFGAETQDEALLGRIVDRLAETNTVTWSLAARFGSTTPKTLAYLRKREAEPFDVAVISLGLNDVVAGTSLREWLAAYQDLAAVLRDRYGVAYIVASGLPPVSEFPAAPQPLRWVLGRQARDYDEALEAWADGEPDVSYVAISRSVERALSDLGATVEEVMSRDGFHPGPRVYDEWGRRVVEALRAANAAPEVRPQRPASSS